MSLDQRIIAFISIGAAVAANCHPCLQHHKRKAIEAGLTEQEIREAAEVGQTVRKGAAKQMDQLINGIGGKRSVVQSECSKGCCC